MARVNRPIEILLVEDNPGDVRLTQEAMKDAKIENNLTVAADGIHAMDYLRSCLEPTGPSLPDLILLDLNMPRMDGREVLAELKVHSKFKSVPVVILTTSDAEIDVISSYEAHANCYITKPVDLEQFMKIVRSIEDFWFSIVRLPVR
jgi:chemotaxis family two-component system response regulator Rcp1